MMLKLFKVFVAGFLATNLHQAALHGLHLAGLVPRMAWNMAPTEPLGVPEFISLSFWAGIWALALWWPSRAFKGARFWAWWIITGAVGPSVVALLVVFPLKGAAFAGGWDPMLWGGAFLLNGIWGLGCAALLRALRA